MNNGKNRQGLAAAAALAFGVLVLAVPEAATRGFAGGTALCLQSVLPALFPFFVVCELLTAAPPPAVLLRPMQRVLGLESVETARALLLSWVGGYAVCARLAGQLYGAGRITRRDAALLQVLGCCSGPGFVIGCVGGALLGNVRLGVVLYAALGGAAALYGCCACLSVLGVSVWAQLRLFAGAAYRPRLLVFSRAVHLVLLQLLVRVCALLLPGSVTACSTLAARVLPVFRLPPDAAAAGFVFLCAALYKARQSLYNKK